MNLMGRGVEVEMAAAAHNLNPDLKPSFSKGSTIRLLSIQFGRPSNLSVPGIDYHMVTFYKFFTTDIMSMHEYFQRNPAPP